MHCTRCSRVAFSCSLEQSCMTTHVGRMAAQVIRVAQVTGACDDIRFRAPMGHLRSATTVWQTWLYMSMHGGSAVKWACDEIGLRLCEAQGDARACEISGHGGVPSYQVPSINGPPKSTHGRFFCLHARILDISPPPLPPPPPPPPPPPVVPPLPAGLENI